MTKRADEACVHRRVCGDHMAEVYLSRDMTGPNTCAVRVVFFDAAGNVVDEHHHSIQRNEGLALTCKRRGQPDFVLPDPNSSDRPMRLASTVSAQKPRAKPKRRRAA